MMVVASVAAHERSLLFMKYKFNALEFFLMQQQFITRVSCSSCLLIIGDMTLSQSSLHPCVNTSCNLLEKSILSAGKIVQLTARQDLHNNHSLIHHRRLFLVFLSLIDYYTTRCYHSQYCHVHLVNILIDPDWVDHIIVIKRAT